MSLNILSVKLLSPIRIPWDVVSSDKIQAGNGVTITGQLGVDWVVITKSGHPEAMVVRPEYMVVESPQSPKTTIAGGVRK